MANRRRSVAIVQPYFVPYAGYFRLFSAADVVVMLDCVQFPRRGWVHRNRMPAVGQETDWFTLPIAKCNRDTQIRNVRLRPDVRDILEKEVRRFPMLAAAHKSQASYLERVLAFDDDDLAKYLIELVEHTTTLLGLHRPMKRSSELDIPPEIHGQTRIIEITRRMDATTYINPSGGRALYDSNVFASHGLDLLFLNPYQSSTNSILARMLSESAADIAAEIVRETVVAP